MPTYIRGYTLGSNRAKKQPDTGESGETYDTETLSERLRRPARNDIHYRTLIPYLMLIKIQAESRKSFNTSKKGATQLETETYL